MSGKMEEICPRCEKPYGGFPALSRRDNETAICPQCGTEEALIDFGLSMVNEDHAKTEVAFLWREIAFLRKLGGKPIKDYRPEQDDE